MADALFCFDTETTGINPHADSIVQIAGLLVVRDDSGVYRKKRVLNTFCVPKAPMAKEAEEVHKITPDKYKWAVTERTAAEALLDEVDRFDSQFGPLVIAGHNSERFDTPLVERIAGRAGISGKPHIDTYYMALRLAPPDYHKLGAFFNYLTWKEPIDAHDAMADITMVADLCIWYCEKHNISFRQLADWLSVPIVLETMPWGKNEKGKKVEDVGIGFWQWLQKNNKDGLPRDMQHTMDHCMALIREKGRKADRAVRP